MTPFRDALEAQLVCKCGEKNSPDRPHAIKIDAERITRAGCDTCGTDGPIQNFLPTKRQEAAC